jgi:hypothetical protein
MTFECFLVFDSFRQEETGYYYVIKDIVFLVTRAKLTVLHKISSLPEESKLRSFSGA